MVAHICNPTYLEGSDQEDCSLKPALEKNSETPSQQMLGVVIHAWHPSYVEHENYMTLVKAGPGQNVKLYLKNK
jgi:hypothetical protein